MDPRIARLYDDYTQLAWSRTMAFFRKALG